MNRPPQHFRRVPPEALRAFAETCFLKSGLRPDHAAQVAGLLTEADLRGVHSHGTRQVPGYCRSLHEKKINPEPNLRVVRESPNSVLVDGDGGLGYAPMMMATQIAIKKARENGISAAATRHIGHYGAAGFYVRRAMQAGCTAFSVQGGPSAIAPPADGNRTQSAYWGNPPMCFGVPGRNEPPLVLDMATCIFSDEQRNSGSDDLQERIPAAFFKSMGLTGVAVAMGGAFVGVDDDKAKQTAARWPNARGGGLIVVMDLGLFTDADQVRDGVDAMVSGVRQHMEPVRGYPEATLPGTPEQRNEQLYRREGIPLDLADCLRLEEIAAELDLDKPWD
jgi:L-2-hydroxycarboxylate dehydrogenase (NAD+)